MNIISNFNKIEIYFFIYLVIINVFSFVLFGIDKGRAKRKAWRIREGVLIGISMLGASIGSLIGMIFFKHKLSKKTFYIGIPCILLFNKLIELGILNYIRK